MPADSARDMWDLAFKRAAEQDLRVGGVSEECAAVYVGSYACVPPAEAANILSAAIKSYRISDDRARPTPSDLQEAFSKIFRGAYLVAEGFRTLEMASQRAGQENSEYGWQTRKTVVELARVFIGRLAKRSSERAFKAYPFLNTVLPWSGDVGQAKSHQKQLPFVRAFALLGANAASRSKIAVPPADRVAKNVNVQFVADIASAWKRVTGRKPSLSGKAGYDSPFYKFAGAMYGHVQGRMHATVLAERPHPDGYPAIADFQRVLEQWDRRKEETSKLNLPSVAVCKRLLQESAKCHGPKG